LVTRKYSREISTNKSTVKNVEIEVSFAYIFVKIYKYNKLGQAQPQEYSGFFKHLPEK